MPVRLFKITFASFTSMEAHPIREGLELDEAKDELRRFLRAHRKRGYDVCKCGKWQWELTKDDVMIGYGQGVVSLRPEAPVRRRFRR